MRRYLFLTVTLVLFLSITVNTFAATYYVATTGNNGNTGTKAQPWATLSKAVSSISNGDTVIVDKGTYKEKITISTANVTFQNAPGELPIIDGDEVIPDSEWGALVRITANGVTFDGFEVRESGGIGIDIQGAGADNVTVKNCEVHETYRHALKIVNGADNVLIEDCDIHHGAKKKVIDASGNNPPSVMIKNSINSTFRRCKIHDSYNEGINIGDGSHGVTVEYCEIYGNPKSNLYLCCSVDATVRYNLIYGTTNGKGPGIWVNNEEWCYDAGEEGGHRIYGNLVANTIKCFWLAGRSDRPVKNVIVYNNTFVEATDCGIFINSDTGDGHVFKNNIIWQSSGKVAIAPSILMICDYNLWSREPDNDVKGAHDLIYAVPQLAKTSGWNSLEGGNLNGSEFALQSGSPAIDAGTPLGAEFYYIPECDKSVWPAQIVLMDQNKQGSGREIGADIHVANPTTLASPTGLKISAGQ